MNRSGEEDQGVGRVNNDGKRIDHHIHSPLLNAAALNPEPVQADVARVRARLPMEAGEGVRPSTCRACRPSDPRPSHTEVRT